MKNGFFGENEFFGCFDIYVWGLEFCFVLVCVECFEKWFIILGFLVGSGCLIWWKCKDFDSKLGGFGGWLDLGKNSWFEEFVLGLWCNGGAGVRLLGFFGISLNVLMSKKNFFSWLENFLGWEFFAKNSWVS